jgi:DNA-binding NarL/FixJ family response regulator
MITTVAIVEDDRRLRATLEQIVDDAPGLRCLETFDCAEDALRDIPANRPNLVLMDINLPNLSGIECTARLKSQFPDLQILMLTVYEDTDSIFKALKAGASGYLLKRSDPSEIIEAIHDVRAGGAPMTSQIARKVVQSFRDTSPTRAQTEEELSRREEEILDLLSKGYLLKEIAEQLSLSPNTVKTHLRHIYDKLHVRSRTEAVIRYLK